MYKRIVAGTDLSKTARIATDRAADLARLLEAELVLVHAGSDGGEALTSLAESYGATSVTEDGNPAEVLIAQTEKLGADLLVVGSVGMSGARRFLLGSVPNKVSHHSTTDLLIVKTDPPPARSGTYTKAVVGTDGSPTAMRAVDAACELSAKLGLQPIVVCAYEPLTDRERDQLRADPNDPVAQWSAGSRVRAVPDEFRWRIAGAEQAEDILDRASSRASEKGVEAEVRAIEGSPPDVLISVAESERADLIAVGSVGLRGAKRFMLGNVPHRITHHAPNDILILQTA